MAVIERKPIADGTHLECEYCKAKGVPLELAILDSGATRIRCVDDIRCNERWHESNPRDADADDA